MHKGKNNARRAVAAGVLGLGLALAGNAARAGDDSIARDAIVLGASYAEWSARWWQWFLSIPYAESPAGNDGGANCAKGQSGPVWFLAGSLFQPLNTTWTRTCPVKAGKLLFLPLTNTIWGSGVGDCAPTSAVACNYNDLRLIAEGVIDTVTTLDLKLDGKPLRDLRRQRVQTGVIPLTLVAGNVFGAPAGAYETNVSDGYWLMLEPLNPGLHKLELHAVSSYGVVKVSYTLMVQ